MLVVAFGNLAVSLSAPPLSLSSSNRGHSFSEGRNGDRSELVSRDETRLRGDRERIKEGTMLLGLKIELIICSALAARSRSARAGPEKLLRLARSNRPAFEVGKLRRKQLPSVAFPRAADREVLDKAKFSLGEAAGSLLFALVPERASRRLTDGQIA